MSGSLRFAGYELDLTAYALRCDGKPVKLEKLPMEVLILLVRSAGALLTRPDIESALWGAEVFVDRDAAINTAIRKVRQALGDDAARPRFVETVVGKGYRFVAPVEGSRSALGGAIVEGPNRRAGSQPFPQYVIVRGGQKVMLETGQTILGRDPAAAVCIDHPSVSRRHAAISIGPDGAVLADLSSRNGTFLNGRRVDGAVPLAHGAIIGLGPVTLSVLVLRAPASTQSVSADCSTD